MSTFSFPDAVRTVEAWLDGIGASFAHKLPYGHQSKRLEWAVDLTEHGYPVQSVTLRIGPLFPAVPCELYVSAALCLVLPHIEEDGRVCLGEVCQPADFTHPVEAVVRVLARFRTELLERSANQDWREAELHAERLSYWSRFCDLRQQSPRGRPRPRNTLVDFKKFGDWAEGQIASYIPKNSRHRRIHTQVVALGEVDPADLAKRYGFNSGTLVKGDAVFVRIPDELSWNPSVWPKSFLELESLVRTVSDDKHSIARWLERREWSEAAVDEADTSKTGKVTIGLRPLLVVLCHGNEPYGYQISQPTVSLVTLPHAAPVKIFRIDAAWSLTRDYSASAFDLRQSKRILVLGVGSLGSSVVDVLARSGIGSLDIVDSQVFDSANVSRHLLGLPSIFQSKAKAIAARLKKEIPGLEVRGFQEDSQRWCTENCRPGAYDLIVDLTAESSVRTFLAYTRRALLGDAIVIHGWVEPFCAATHVVATTSNSPWPATDPAGARVNAADYSAAQVRVQLPACSDGFHPYGSADIIQASGFCAERILDVVDHGLSESTVWSFIRTRAFFDSLDLPITTNAIVPTTGGPRDGVMMTRPLRQVLADN